MKIAFLVLCLFLSLSAFAKGKVLILKGSATFGGHAIKPNSSLQGKGEIKVADKSYLKIQLSDSQTVVVLAANTTSQVDFNQKKENEEVTLVNGLARWITGPNASKNSGGIKTKNASMGVRGTDFYTSYNPLLGETEIICFDGAIEMMNLSNEDDKKMVKKNQWGGLGGRFGSSLSNILDLSPELISSFDKALPK